MNLFGETPTSRDLVREILEQSDQPLTLTDILAHKIARAQKLTWEDITNSIRDLQERGAVRQSPPDEVCLNWRYYLTGHASHAIHVTPAISETQQPTGTLAS